MDRDNKNLGKYNMIKEKVINNPYFRGGSLSGQVKIEIEYTHTYNANVVLELDTVVQNV